MGKLSVLAVVLCVLGMAGVAFAAPGTSSALNGVEDIFTGYLPPPGFHLLNYVLYYDGTSIRDDKGEKIPGANATVIAEAVRLLYMPKDVQILGGRPGWHVIVPFIHKDLELPGGYAKSFSGMGDMYVSPIIIGWDFPEPNFHVAAGIDVIMPTGEYDRSNLITTMGPYPINPGIGSHHWTFEPVLAVTKIFGESGIVLDAKFMYDIHTEEPDTDITTGDQFHTDFAATMPVSTTVPLRVGANGYYFQSLEQDRYQGTKIPGSKEQVLAIGPMVRYDFAPVTSLSLKVQFEQYVRNRPDGQAVWLKFVHSF
ncbi:MAG TPA: transporter [Planctomycetota bacterium]|nr:transporter [Planctomycetota bacterium]